MKNKEKYAKEIVEAVKNGGGFCFRIDINEIRGCYDDNMLCCSCLFGGDCVSRCDKNKFEWCESEWKYRLTRFEYELLGYYSMLGMKYVAKDKSGHVYFFKEKPIKNFNANVWAELGTINSYVGPFYNLFPDVKWSDELPTSIDDILLNCEVI